jgi:hypothetical protein
MRGLYENQEQNWQQRDGFLQGSIGLKHRYSRRGHRFRFELILADSSPNPKLLGRNCVFASKKQPNPPYASLVERFIQIAASRGG